jgi:hypothetical protein
VAQAPKSPSSEVTGDDEVAGVGLEFVVLDARVQIRADLA